MFIKVKYTGGNEGLVNVDAIFCAGEYLSKPKWTFIQATGDGRDDAIIVVDEPFESFFYRLRCAQLNILANAGLLSGEEKSVVQPYDDLKEFMCEMGAGLKRMPGFNTAKTIPPSMTSVVQWVRYDGTEETLPKKGPEILHLALPSQRWASGVFSGERNGQTNQILDEDGCGWELGVGDLWAYRPAPPECTTEVKK